MEIVGTERRIPDGILYIVLEFKTAIQENTTIHNAYVQLATRYKRDIPELFKYNVFCIISDAKYPDRSKREDIKSALKVGLIILLDEHGYPPVERDEVYKDLFEQAENFKKNRVITK